MMLPLGIKRIRNFGLSGEEIVWYCLFFLQAFPIVVPDGLSTLFPYVNALLYEYWQYLAVISLVYEFLHVSVKNGRYSKLVTGVVLILGYLVLLTYAHSGNFIMLYRNYGMMLYAVLLIHNKQAYMDRVISGLLLILKLWIYINFLCMIAIPGGMYKSEANNSWYCWILGYKSSFQYYILPAICLSWLNMEYRGKKVQFYFLCAISAYEAIFSNNTMLMIGLAVMLVFYFFKLFRFVKIFHMQNYLIVSGVANILYIFFISYVLSLTWVQHLLQFFGKNLTLSYRLSLIVPNTLEAIQRNWLFGHGVWGNQRRIAMYDYFKGAIHAHNQVLELVFVGGLLLLAAYVVLNLLLNYKLMKCRKMESAKILSLSVFILYIMMLVEVFTRRVGGPLWCMLFLAYYCNKVDFSMRQCKDCILPEMH